ncbi:MAG: hypothetical protein N2255_00975 [Kiritimatiellae bacterium]|nr:hypothetical protein [Kiritimatiellia bacterium]
MTLVRRLNDGGIRRFSEFLHSLKTDPSKEPPVEILTNQLTSEELGCQIDIEQKSFGSRLEAARYLFEKFGASELRGIEKDTGLWAWLSLFYFDQLCPADKQGRRKPGELARWVPEVTNYQRYYRHLLAGPYLIYRAHRDRPERALALLCQQLHSPGDIVEQLASRQELVTNKAVVECATKLYFDAKTQKLKKGARAKGGGSVRRLAEVLNQFDLTWDLYAMNADALFNLLPSEFDPFKPH